MAGSTIPADITTVSEPALASGAQAAPLAMDPLAFARALDAHRARGGRARRAPDEQDLRRHARPDLAAIAVGELSSRLDSSPSAAVTTAEAALAEDRAGTGSGQPVTGDPVNPAGTGEFQAQPGAGRPGEQSPEPAATPKVARGDATQPAEADKTAVDAKPSVTAGAKPAANSPQNQALPGALAAPVVASATPVAAASSAPGPVAPVSKAGDTAASSQRIDRPAPPPRPYQLEESDFAKQVSRAMSASLRQRGGTVTMRLSPDALGQVRVALTLTGGRVDATFEASTDRARQLLGDGLTALRAALEAQGLAVDRLDVQGTDAPARENPGTGSSESSGGGRQESESASEHAGQNDGAGGGDASGLNPHGEWAEPTRLGMLLTGGAHGIRLRLDAVA